MKQSKLQVFDPPMCCSSGVCGPNVNPDLVNFSSDLDWLRAKGVKVERYNLSSNPAAFAQEESVREALTKEGNDCLPLILVDGTIVSRGKYPSRSNLMELTGMNKNSQNSNSSVSTDAKGEESACGPGCACNTTSYGKGIKAAISLVVLIAVIGVLVFKASNAKSFSAKSLDFSNAQTGPAAMLGADAQASKSVESSTAGQKIGESLESLKLLNKVALSQDAVFIYIPAKSDEPAASKTNDAILAAQKALKAKNIALGLYTLPVSSSDYSAISAQVQSPAILVACKGKGMVAVSGDVTETKLLQAFTASSRAGGCGAGGCGPSGSCN